MEIMSWEPVRTWVIILALGVNEWQTPYLRSRMDLRLMEAFETRGVPPNQIQWIGDQFGTATVFNNVHKYAEESQTAAGHRRADDNEVREEDENNNKQNQIGLLQECVSAPE